MTMIEKVARAIACSNENDIHWNGYIVCAKAAIEAMREPTEEMKDVCVNMVWVSTYQKMIDVALKE